MGEYLYEYYNIEQKDLLSAHRFKKLFKNNSSFFLRGLSGHFHLCHRSRSYGYAPSSKAETVSKIPHNKMRESFLNNF